jgi:hypothetical protein
MAIKMPLLRSLVACLGPLAIRILLLRSMAVARKISRFKAKGSALGVEFGIWNTDSAVFYAAAKFSQGQISGACSVGA